jgi:hypothetical protein
MLALTYAAMGLRSSESESHRRLGAHVEAERDGAPGAVRLELVGPVEGERPAGVGQGEPGRFGRVGDREAGGLRAREPAYFPPAGARRDRAAGELDHLRYGRVPAAVTSTMAATGVRQSRRGT